MKKFIVFFRELEGFLFACYFYSFSYFKKVFDRVVGGVLKVHKTVELLNLFLTGFQGP